MESRFMPKKTSLKYFVVSKGKVIQIKRHNACINFGSCGVESYWVRRVAWGVPHVGQADCAR